MAQSKYFSIPFSNHPALVELQAYLKGKLPPDAQYQERGTFHITLTYAPDPGEADLSNIAVPGHLPIFGLAGFGLRVFEPSPLTGGESQYAVVLEIDREPQLTYLQAFVYYELRARGLEVSGYTAPGLWKPHITLAYVPKQPNMEMPVYIEMPMAVYLQVDKFTLQGEGYSEIAAWQLMAHNPDGSAISEMSRIHDVLIVGEFKGNYPDVLNFPGVNIAELTGNDGDPFFVILPVAQDDVTSGNGRHYSAAFVAELERQMREKRPTGNLGHLRDEDRGTAFPLPAGYWVGAQKVGKTLWGKAYVPPGQVREMIRTLKAAGSKLATSIYGPGDAEWDAKRGAWVVNPDSFILEHIDFAPPDRAGIGALATVPHIVGEMVSEEKNPMSDKKAIVSELTAEDLKGLPEVVRNAFISELAEFKQLNEVRQVLGLEAGADVIKAVKEMQAVVAENKRQALQAAVVAEVAAVVVPGVTGNEAVDDLRATVAEMVQATDAAGVKAAVTAAVEKPHIKRQMEKLVVGEMGPAQGRAVKPGQGSEENKFFDIPE